MRRLLLDVNVVLDVLLERPPFAAAAARLWAAAERREIEVLVPAHGITTVFYVAARQRGTALAWRVVGDLLAVAGVAAVDEATLRRALTLPGPDFEDAVCAAAAESSACDLLVTRDPAGFRGAAVPVVDPDTAASLIAGAGPEGVQEGSATTPRVRPARRPRTR